jgi:succinate dehydrogenase / fumarate reductase flavoprotein subunit
MINENTEEIRDFYADFVVIASGGMNKVFGKISGSLHNDGFVSGKLLNQGIELANMEMIQYHPTTIETPVKRMLITEAARGEGGRLYTLRNGEKWYFMEEWYPEQGALMPRDVVSRSIYRVCHEDDMGIDGENKVYLDLTHLDEKTVKTKLDEVYDVCMNYLNLDPTREPIPVYPGVHYFMGGIRTDDAHKTNIRNLFAIGECSSQYHGANRLGGNSLLGAIHGGWVVADQLEEISCENNSFEEYEILNYEYDAYENWKELQKEANNISSYEIEEEIANIMNRTMGIYRTESELKEGLNKLDSLETIHVNSHGCYYDYILLKSLTDIAKAMLSSALARKESRGAHQRLDYPETNEEYLKTTVISFDNDELKITFNDTEERMSW